MANEFKVKNGLIVENGLYLISYTGSSTDLMIISSTGSVGRTTSTAYLNNTYFTQNGNSFGATAVLGTNDSQTLGFETNGVIRSVIGANGNISFGTLSTTFSNTYFKISNNTLNMFSVGTTTQSSVFDVRNDGSFGSDPSAVVSTLRLGSDGYINVNYDNKMYFSYDGQFQFLTENILYGIDKYNSLASKVKVAFFHNNVISTSINNNNTFINTTGTISSDSYNILRIGGNINNSGIVRGIYITTSVISGTYHALQIDSGDVVLNGGSFSFGYNNTNNSPESFYVKGITTYENLKSGSNTTIASFKHDSGTSLNIRKDDITFYTNTLFISGYNSERTIGIGTITPTASLHIISQYGATAPSSNKALLVENSEGTKLFNIQSNAQIGIGSYSNGTGLHPITIYNTGKVFIKNSAGDSALDYSLLVDTNVGNTLGLLNGKLYVNQTITTFLNKGISIETNASTQSIAVFKISSNNNWSYQNPSFKAAILIDGQYLGQSTNATFSAIDISPILTTNAGYTGNLRGLYYNPDISGMTLGTHRAIETTSGDVIFNGGNVGIGTYSASKKLSILGETIINGNFLTSSTNVRTFDVVAAGGGHAFSVRSNGLVYISNGNLYVEGDGISTLYWNSRIYFANNNVTASSTNANIELYGGVKVYTWGGTATNTEIFRIAGNGFVGIGTQTASYRLDVVSGATISARFDGRVIGVTAVNSNEYITLGQLTSSASNYFVQNGNTFGATAVLGTNDNYGLQFKTNNSNILTLKENGFVGLGTENPSKKLHIYGTTSIRFESSSGNNTTGLELVNAYQTTIPLFGMYFYAGGGSIGNNVFNEDANNSPQNILFSSALGTGLKIPLKIGSVDLATVSFYSNSLERMVIAATGNIGIGTASPQSLLHLYGNQAKLKIQNSGSGTNGIEFVDYSGGLDGSITLNQSSGEIRYYAAASYFPTFYSNNLLAMSIDVNRNINVTKSITFTQSGGLGYIRFNKTTNTNGSDDLLIGYYYLGAYQFADFQTSTKGMSIDTTNNIVNVKNLLTVTGTATVMGNIGVGTNTPSTKLHIFGDTTIQAATNSSPAVLNLYAQNTSPNRASIIFKSPNGTNRNLIHTRSYDSGLNDGIFEFVATPINGGQYGIYRFMASDDTTRGVSLITSATTSNGITSLYIGTGSSKFNIGIGNTNIISIYDTTTIQLPILTGSQTDLMIISSTGSVGRTSSTVFMAGNYFAQNGNSFGATAVLGTNDNYGLQLETNGVTTLTIGTNNNVGIGIVPNNSYKLAILGNVTFNSGAMLDFGYGNMRIIDGAGNHYLAIHGWNGSSIDERIRIKGNGDVGINTTTPSQKLHVVGDILVGNYGGTSCFIRWANVSTVSNSAYIGTINNEFTIFGGSIGTFNIQVPIGFSTASLVFLGNGVRTMQLYNASVRIGGNTTTAPLASLEINGTSSTLSSTLLLKNNVNNNFEFRNDGSSIFSYGETLTTNPNSEAFRFSVNSSNALVLFAGRGAGAAANTSGLYVTTRGNVKVLADLSGDNIAFQTSITHTGVINDFAYVRYANYFNNNIIQTVGTPSQLSENYFSGTIEQSVSNAVANILHVKYTGTVSGIFRGLYINNTFNSITGKNVAIETTTGSVIFNNTKVGINIGSGTPSYSLHLYGDAYMIETISQTTFWLHSNGNIYNDIGSGKSFFFRDLANSNNTILRVHPAANAITIEPEYNLVARGKISVGTYGITHNFNISGTQSYDSSVGINELKTQRELTTNSTVPSKIWNYTTSATQIVVAINAKVVGKSTLNPTDSIYVYLRGSVKSDITGTLYMMANPVYDVFRDDLTTDVTLAVNGNDIQILVTGTNDNWIWKAVVEYDIIS